MNYIYFFAFLAALCVIDFNMIHWLQLQVKRLDLAVERFFFLLKLRIDIFTIKRGWQDKKFERMADELMKELGINEAD